MHGENMKSEGTVFVCVQIVGFVKKKLILSPHKITYSLHLCSVTELPETASYNR